MPKRLGVLGGTFSPIHIGHLRAAEEAIEALGLDSFLFLPAAVPPHKTTEPILSFEHRWRLLNLAIADNPRLQASDLELHLGGKSYTVRSLSELRRRFDAGSDIFFLLGLDSFLEIATWWRYQELFQLAQLVVMRRPSYRDEHIEILLHERVSQHYHWNAEQSRLVHPTLLPVHYLKMTRIDVSSTQIRRLVAQGRSIRYLVPPDVISYITNNDLYRDGPAPMASPRNAGGMACPGRAGVSLVETNSFAEETDKDR
jgi:nicotinate-nucleotide adenylyltransferase